MYRALLLSTAYPKFVIILLCVYSVYVIDCQLCDVRICVYVYTYSIVCVSVCTQEINRATSWYIVGMMGKVGLKAVHVAA